MIMEVYYEHSYTKGYDSEKYKDDKSVLPYMVLIRDTEKREQFRAFLESCGYRCCQWNCSYPGVLVNTRFRRFALIHRSCRFGCVDSRNYTLQEFMDEVFFSVKPEFLTACSENVYRFCP